MPIGVEFFSFLSIKVEFYVEGESAHHYARVQRGGFLVEDLFHHDEKWR